MFYMTINGTKHAVTIMPNGQKQYDPPLNREFEDRCAAKCKDMLQSQKPPGHFSDTSFHAGRGTLLDQLEGDAVWASHLAKQAKKRGYNVGANDVYLGQLDDAQGGNPNAFFKAGEGRSELKRRLQKTGQGCDMPGLHVEATKQLNKVALNPKITKRLMASYKASGAAAGKTDAELKSFIEKKHGRPA